MEENTTPELVNALVELMTKIAREEATKIFNERNNVDVFMDELGKISRNR